MHRRAFLALGALLPLLPEPAAALPAAPAPAPVGGDELAAFRRKGSLRVGVAEDYVPFAAVSGGRRTGLDIELGQLAGSELGMRADFVPFKWPELSSRIDRGEFDVVASGITMRADRLFFGRFTRPYALTGAVACVRKEDAARYRQLADLDKPAVRIAVNRGGHLARVARDTFPRATLDLVDNTALFDRVTSKAADAIVSDSAEVYAAARTGLATIGPFTRDRKALYVRRDLPELARYFDQWILRHEEDGALQRLRRKWLGTAEPTGAKPHLEAVLADLELRFDLMPSVGAAKRAAGMPVEDRAQEERVLARTRDLAKENLLDPASVEALYRVLVRVAKVIQTAPVMQASPTVTLEALRTAIGDVDEHLLASLRTSAPRVPKTEWQRAVTEGVTTSLVPKLLLAELGRALAAVHRVQGA
jgi:cyclohexadienyl dehydratase